MDGGGAAAVQVLVQNLIDVSKGEISLIRGLKKNAHKLQSSLTLIHSYLDDAEKKLTTDEAVRTWLKQLEDVGFDAHNVLDELNYHDIKRNMKMIRGEKEKVPSCFPSCNHYLLRRRMALRINEIYIRFESSKDDATKLRLNSMPTVAYALPLETDPDTLDPVFIGRDKDVSDIVDQMLTNEEPLYVLPIVGMGGQGKTTLTRKVFKHERIKAHFGKQIWVHVSRDFDVVILLKKILENLTSEGVEDASRVVLLKKFGKELGNKKYLLVLDDMWNEDARMWEDFANSLSGITSTKGNFILVTTRSNDVASIVASLVVHNLNVLSKEDCWSIIKQKALRINEDIPFGFESIRNDIAKRCQGLPLAADVVGGLLYRTPKDKWISAAQDWLSNLQVDDNDISKILRLSYDHLSPPSLKRCFAYCSIFPKGKVIDKQKLIELWMAQGFLQIDPKNGMELEGNKFFYFLVQNSLLQVATKDEYDNTTHCIMHDLVHDLACIVSKGVYQVQYIGSKISGDEPSSSPKERWRTLFFQGKVLSDVMFLDFKNLHALTVKGINFRELPSSISELIHLRFININQTRIQNFPEWIGEFYHLQTIRGKHLSKLPSSIQYLINLRHLHLWSHTKLPPNIGRLTCLQTLEYYHVGKEESHGIGQLGRLKQLQGDLHIFYLENVHHQEEAESAFLSKKPKMYKLVLQWSTSREGETNDENVLEGLRPHPNLKSLKIIGFKGTRFPSWTSDMAIGLYNLVEVSLEDLSECEEVPMMWHLPYLKSLSLTRLKNLKFICSSFVDSSCKEPIVVFPVLKWLRLSEMPNLIEWIEIENHPFEVKLFPCLEELDIYSCKQLRIAPSQLPWGSLTLLSLRNLDELEFLPDLTLNNQNLSELSIICCDKLREFPNGLETLNSLKELRIYGCQNFTSIPYRSNGESQGLTSLHTLAIEKCKGLISLPCEMLESCAPTIQFLELRKLSSLINLPMIIECLPKMPRLQALTIHRVPKLISYCKFFPNLQYLSIWPAASDPSDCAMKAVDGMLQAASHSLDHLLLYGVEDWDSLPDSLQHFKVLCTLHLKFFRIEELPEWLRNLTSLEILHLYTCHELKSVEAIRGLKKLTQLAIRDCPALKSWIEQNSDVVSHIPEIIIDS